MAPDSPVPTDRRIEEIRWRLADNPESEGGTVRDVEWVARQCKIAELAAHLLAAYDQMCGSPASADHRSEEMRELLGQQVRLIWIAWAEEQPNPKPSWLKPWHQLSEPEREVDRRIGERLYTQGRSVQWEVLAADLSKVMADRDRWLVTAREYEAAIGVLAPENDRVGTENERLRAEIEDHEWALEKVNRSVTKLEARAQRAEKERDALAAQIQRVRDRIDRSAQYAADNSEPGDPLKPYVSVASLRAALDGPAEADQ